MSRRFFAALAVVLVFASCSRPAPDSEPVSSEATVPEPTFPEGGTIRIVYREGGAEILRGSDRPSPESGFPLALGDRIRTASDGVLEVSLEDLASFRLLPSSEAEVRFVRFGPSGSRAEVFVRSGSALFSVRGLSSGESFEVFTPEAALGVRGTQFMVSAGDATTVAVREGRVAVVPAGPALERVAAAAASNAVARAALRAVIARAAEVGPSQEIRVGEDARARSEESYERLEAVVSGRTEVPLASGFPEEPWFLVGEPATLPASDAEAERSYALVEGAADAAGSRFAVPVNAGPETLRGFERFRDFRSGPPSLSVSPPPKAPTHPAVLGRTSLSSRPLAGSIVRVPDIDVLISVDDAGTLCAFDSRGGVLWSVKTKNRGDPRNYPVTYKGAAYFGGDAELLSVDGKDGTVLARRALEPGLKAGERPVVFPDSLLLPTDTGFDVLDPATLETKSSVPVAGGPGTLPTQRDSFALIVNKDGELMLMDPVAGSVRARTSTGARGAAAVSPRIFEEKACFADRTGLVVLVDLEAMSVLWERRTGAAALTDIEIAREGVLAYGDGTLFGFRLDGEPLMDPVSGVSAPPLLSKGTVFYGTLDGDLVVAQASPWRIRGTIPLGAAASARPLQVGDTLYIGTRDGRLVRVDANKLP